MMMFRYHNRSGPAPVSDMNVIRSTQFVYPLIAKFIGPTCWPHELCYLGRGIVGCACEVNAGNVFALTRMTHVPWCMPGSLTCVILWSWWRRKRSRHSRRMRNPQLYVSAKRPMARSSIPWWLKCHSPLHSQNINNYVTDFVYSAYRAFEIIRNADFRLFWPFVFIELFQDPSVLIKLS